MNIPRIGRHAAAPAGAPVFVFVFVFVLAFALAGAAVACGQQDPQGVQVAEVQTQPPVDPPQLPSPAVAYSFYEPKSEEGLKADTNYGFLLAKAGPDFDVSAFKKLGVEVLGRFSANGGTYYRLHKDDGVLDALNRAKGLPGLAFVEPEPKMHLAGPLSPGEYGSPGDPRVDSEQWGAHAIKAVDAWKTFGFGPNRPVVANIDTGVRFGHEDLGGRVLHAYSWYMADGSTPLSYADLGLGYSYVPSDEAEPVDYRLNPNSAGNDGNSHGTMTCGIMAAEGNNGKGMAGVCWAPDLISYKGLSNSGNGDMWGIFGSLWHLSQWKKKNNHTGTIPVNLSIGMYYASYFATDMIEYGLQNGVMVVAASGNDGIRAHVYPGAYSGVMAVGGTTGADVRWRASNYGRHLSVVAPALNVVGPNAGGNAAYSNAAGTSFAAPHVTGLIGYMLTFNPSLKPDQIRTYIERNADPIDGATGYTEECGWGRINVLRTIQAVKADYDSGATPPSQYGGGAYINLMVDTGGGVLAPWRLPWGTNVYLYQCDAEGKIANYVASATAGQSWLDWDPSMGTAPRVGDRVYFPMLRPGHYVAKSHISIHNPFSGTAVNESSTTPVFQVAAGGAEKEMDLVIRNVRMLYVQTFPTSDPIGGNTADTQIRIGSISVSPFGTIVNHVSWSGDLNYYDTLNFYPAPSEPGTYFIKVFGYSPESLGEYALHFTYDNTHWQPSPAPLTYATAGQYQGSKGRTPDTSQLIAPDTIYYGLLDEGNYYETPDDFNSGGDWYRFVIP